MSEAKPDRRVQRTRELLQRTLIQLIREKGYDAVTIQNITDRANLGRTTFYLHYQTKDDLLLGHFEDFATDLNLNDLTPEQVLGAEPTPSLASFLNQLANAQTIYRAFTAGKDAKILVRGIREQMTRNLCKSLNRAFPESRPTMPLDVLAQYIVGAQLSLIDWWMSNRTEYDANQIATILHQLQRAAVRGAYQVQD